MKEVPQFPLRLLKWFCHDNYHRDIEGDLLEFYNRNKENKGQKHAKWQLYKDVILLFRPGIIKPLQIQFNSLPMFKINIKTAWRSFTKHKSYSIINSLGLAVGIAAFLLISLYAQYELSYDSFHVKKENLYRAQLNRYDNDELSTQWAAGAAGIGLAMTENFPEVRRFIKMYPESAVCEYEEKIFSEDNIFYASRDFFQAFSIRLLDGIDSMVLKDPMSIVVSESTARKYFGDDDPVGKTLTLDADYDFNITGVYEDIPAQSHLSADMLISFETFYSLRSNDARTTWSWDGFLTYLELEPGTDPADLESKIPAMLENRWGEEMEPYNHRMEIILQPITEIHKYSDFIGEIKANGDGRATLFLLVVAVFIILIAWVNYVNLSTAKSMERAKEVGIRKVMGSMRKQLTNQFIVESLLLNLFGVLLALIIVGLALPSFNQLTGLNLPSPFTNPLFWVVVGGLFLLGGFLSGIYPAFVLSGFKPINVLKGRLSTSAKGSSVRKGLVVFQFIASLVLMVGTITVYEQMRFMKSQDLGVDIEQTLVIHGPNVVDSLYYDQYNTFKTAVESHASVSSIASSNLIPSMPGLNAGGIKLINQEDSESKQYRFIRVDGDYMKAFDLELAAGRVFDGERSTEGGKVVFNEAAVRHLGFSPEEALNKEIYFWGDTLEIIGVLKNYHQESLKKSHDPLIFRYYPSVTGYYSVKVNTANIQETIAGVEQDWNSIFPGNPFEFFFLEERYNDQYNADMKFGQVFGLFAGLAIFIACLGLFGLASYMTKQRVKEIGIRKVLGASVSSILFLLSRDFIRIIAVAILIAIPISWYVIDQWLQEFASRISISWWLFVVPILVLLLIAQATISFQTTKSALTNPVDTLKDE